MRRLEKLLRPFFDKYDDDNSGQLDKGEFWSVFHDLQEHVQTSVSAKSAFNGSLSQKSTRLCCVCMYAFAPESWSR